MMFRFHLIKKFGVLNEIDKEMERRNSYQGIKHKKRERIFPVGEIEKYFFIGELLKPYNIIFQTNNLLCLVRKAKKL